MTRKPLRSLLSLAVACLLLAGCDDSKNPLSNPRDSKPDSRLAGVWRLRGEEGDVTYYHVGAVGAKLPQSMMRVLGVTHEKNATVRSGGELLIYPTILRGNTYLNLSDGNEQQVKLLEEKGWSAEVAGAFFLLKYKVEGDTLLIWPMDVDAKRQAIQSGKIKGVIEKATSGPDKIEFTDTTENVARFVASADDGLFSKDVRRLERVK